MKTEIELQIVEMVLVAGVDSSTQSVKIVIRDAVTGKLVRQGYASHPDGTEINPTHWFNALNQAILDAGGIEDVAAISIAGQQHGLVMLDHSGNVIRDALLWNDTRSSDAANELNIEVTDIVERTGLSMVASFTASKLRFIAREENHLLSRVAAVCLPHDWLSWKLSGSDNIDTLWTDRSDASGTGYYNPSNDEYDKEIFSISLLKEYEKVCNIKLPTVIPSNKFGGKILNSDIQIGAGAGDNAAAAFGLQVVPGDVVISLGTSGTAFAVADHPVRDKSGTVAGFAAITPKQFLPLVCTLNAARILDAACELLGVTHEVLGQLALESSPGANGLTLIPYFEGERTPNRPHATGSLVGLTLHNSNPKDFARAYIEGMLCGLADAIYTLEERSIQVQRVFLIGGAARNSAVPLIASAIFGREVIVPPISEYVADGAARQAAWAYLGGENPPIWEMRDPITAVHPPTPEVLERYRKVRDRI